MGTKHTVVTNTLRWIWKQHRVPDKAGLLGPPSYCQHSNTTDTFQIAHSNLKHMSHSQHSQDIREQQGAIQFQVSMRPNLHLSLSTYLNFRMSIDPSCFGKTVGKWY